MKRFLLIAACAFLSLGFLSSCQKEEASVLDLARELTKELKTVTDHKSAEAAAPRVEALNKRLQNAMARPYDSGMSGSSLLRSCDKDATDQEGAQLAEALRDLAREVGRVQASLPVERSSDEDVSVPRLRLSVGASNGAKYEDPTGVRYKTAQAHMEGEEERNAVPYPDHTPYCYDSEKLAQALEYKVSPSSVEFFTFDSADDVVNTPASVNPKAEDTEETDGGDTPSADDGGDDTPSTDDDGDDTPSTDDDDTTPAPAGDDDGGLPGLDDTDTTTDDTTTDDDSSDDDSSSDDDGLGDLDISL